MVRIGYDARIGIVKHGHRFLETHAMLGEVRLRLVVVLFIAKHLNLRLIT